MHTLILHSLRRQWSSTRGKRQHSPINPSVCCAQFESALPTNLCYLWKQFCLTEHYAYSGLRKIHNYKRAIKSARRLQDYYSTEEVGRIPYQKLRLVATETGKSVVRAVKNPKGVQLKLLTRKRSTLNREIEA